MPVNDRNHHSSLYLGRIPLYSGIKSGTEASRVSPLPIASQAKAIGYLLPSTPCNLCYNALHPSEEEARECGVSIEEVNQLVAIILPHSRSVRPDYFQHLDQHAVHLICAINYLYGGTTEKLCAHDREPLDPEDQEAANSLCAASTHHTAEDMRDRARSIAKALLVIGAQVPTYVAKFANTQTQFNAGDHLANTSSISSNMDQSYTATQELLLKAATWIPLALQLFTDMHIRQKCLSEIAEQLRSRMPKPTLKLPDDLQKQAHILHRIDAGAFRQFCTPRREGVLTEATARPLLTLAEAECLGGALAESALTYLTAKIEGALWDTAAHVADKNVLTMLAAIAAATLLDYLTTWGPVGACARQRGNDMVTALYERSIRTPEDYP